MIHALKILPEFYQAVIDERKPFEIRKNDRNFQSGDNVVLMEWERGKYTGRECVIRIEDIFDISFIAPEYVAFTFKIIRHFD